MIDVTTPPAPIPQLGAPTPPVAPVAPATPEPPKAGDKEAIAGFVKSHFEGHKLAAKKPDAPVVAKTDEVPPKPPVKPTAKKPAKPVAATPVAKEIDYDRLASTSAAAAAIAVVEAMEKNKKEAPAAVEADLSFLDNEERSKLPALEQLEKMYPEKYKGLSKKFTDSIKSAADYEAEWVKANPSKEFDPEAEEHNDFYNRNEVKWDDDDYTDARVELRSKKIGEEATKPLTEKISKIEADERRRQIEPTATNAARNTAKTMFDALGGEYVNVVANNGAIDASVIKKLSEDSPEIANAVFTSARDLEMLSAENIRLDSAVISYDQNNQLHSRLATYATNQEQAMMSLPEQDRLNKDGKSFMPSAQYVKLTQAQRSKHWTFTAADLNVLLAADTVVNLKEMMTNHEAMLTRELTKRNGGKPIPVIAAAAPAAKPNPTARNGEVEKPLSPSGGDGAFLSLQRGGPSRDGSTGTKRFMNSFMNGNS